jgi:hypothetical protein
MIRFFLVRIVIFESAFKIIVNVEVETFMRFIYDTKNMIFPI